MVIIRTSQISGKEHSMEIDVTEEQLWMWENGELIQNAMPHLSIAEREFIKSGITSEEWDEMFGRPDWDEEE